MAAIPLMLHICAAYNMDVLYYAMFPLPLGGVVPHQ